MSDNQNPGNFGGPPPMPPRPPMRPPGTIQANPPPRRGMPGWAIALIVCGGLMFVAIPVLAIMAGLLLPALAKAKDKAQMVSCMNNLKQVGLAFRVAEGDHKDVFLFNVSTNEGGTMELGSAGPDGFDRNSWVHLRALSNYLGTPRILYCPGDRSSTPAMDFEHLQGMNVTYKLHVGTNVNDLNPGMVLAYCPIHYNFLLVDGSVQHLSKTAAEQFLMQMNAKPRGRVISDQ